MEEDEKLEDSDDDLRDEVSLLDTLKDGLTRTNSASNYHPLSQPGRGSSSQSQQRSLIKNNIVIESQRTEILSLKHEKDSLKSKNEWLMQKLKAFEASQSQRQSAQEKDIESSGTIKAQISQVVNR